MEKKHKIVSTIGGSVLALAIMLALFTPVQSSSVAEGGMFSNISSSVAEGRMFSNIISVELIHPDGTREPTRFAQNKITEEGLNWTRGALSGLFTGGLNTTLNNWTVIELSTSAAAPAEADASCPTPVTGSGMDIARATTIVVGNKGNYTVSKTFSVTGTVTGIQKVCLSNSTTTASTDLMASGAISSTNVASGDTLIVNYSVAAQNTA